MADPHANEIQGLAIGRRLLGLGIATKTLLPIFILVILALGCIRFASEMQATLADTSSAIQPQITQAGEELKKVRAESRRLLAEVAKLKNETDRITDDIRKSIEPIRRSLLGVSGSIRQLAGTVEGVLNGLVAAANKIPGVRLGKVDLKPPRLPGLQLPALNIDVDLEPDLSAVKAFGEAVNRGAEELGQALVDIGRSFSRWFNTLYVAALLLGCWWLLAVIAFCLRAKLRLAVALRLLRGQAVDNASQYF